jgi:hypothetical protein
VNSDKAVNSIVAAMELWGEVVGCLKLEASGWRGIHDDGCEFNGREGGK